MITESARRAKPPVPFQIDANGTVNGVDVQIQGSGAIVCLGQYEAVLNFSDIPPGFHPSAISTYLVSICCFYDGAMRNGALNISSMGADGYRTTRVLTFGDAGQMKISGDFKGDGPILRFEGRLDGEAELPDDLNGNSVYLKRIDPENDGNELVGVGEGSLFRERGEVPVRLDTLHELRPSPLENPLQRTQYRIVTETGELLGKTYRLSINSVVDGNNPAEGTVSMEPNIRSLL